MIVNSIHPANREPKTKNKNVIHAFEHKSVPIKKSGSQDDLLLTEREVQILERLNKKLDSTLFKIGTKDVCFQNWVGIIGLGNRTIEILPKIDYFRKQDEDRNLVRDQLLYMLAAAGEIKHYLVTEAILLAKRMPPLEVYIRLFVTEALKLLRRGLVHNYIKREDEVTFLRGKLRMPEQIKLTARRIPRFSVKYHEFSSDILLNRIIKDVSRMLQSVTQNYENQRELLLIDAILEDISFERHTAKDVDRIIMDRKMYGYEMLLALCKLFLQGRIPDFSTGEIPIIPILFDMNKLFERFIGRILKKMIHNKDESFPYGNILLGAGNIKYLLKNERNEDIIELRPDIRLFKDSNDNDYPSIIIDTKWKELKAEKESRELKGIDVSDIRQMYAYATRYKPERTILLYPKTSLQNEGNRLAVFYADESKCKTIEAWTIDLTAQNTDINTKEERKAFYKSICEQLKKIINWKIRDSSFHSELQARL